MYACICFAVKERDVREAVSGGPVRMSDLCANLGVGTKCGRCVSVLRDILRQATQESQARPVNCEVFDQNLCRKA